MRPLYVLGDDFDAYSASAMWADAKLWAGHMQGWQKIAVVTSHQWVHEGVLLVDARRGSDVQG